MDSLQGSGKLGVRYFHLYLTEDTVSRIAERLEIVRMRPGMYCGAATIDAAVHFLNGFENSLHIFNLFLDPFARREIWIERGWTPHAAADSCPEMLASGLSEEAVVDELLLIAAASWRRTLLIANASG